MTGVDPQGEQICAHYNSVRDNLLPTTASMHRQGSALDHENSPWDPKYVVGTGGPSD